jgi:hypothetical protein
MSKHMKNKMSSGFWHGVFGVTHYHLLYMTELPAGIIQRLHAPTSVTLKMDSAHFSETSCQPRNLQQFQNRTVVRRVVMAWKPLLQIDVLLHLFMFNARSTTEWILQKKKKTENSYSRGVFLKCLHCSVRRKTWLCNRVLFWIRIHILKLKLQYMCMYVCMRINMRCFQNIRTIFAS